jgi:ABC-2 type transport system permease protein
MAVTVGTALVASSFVQNSVLPPNLGSVLPLLVLWFALGFTLYAFGFAAAGALVARQEEVQSVTLPFTALSAAGLLFVYATISSPDSTLVRVLSFLPPLAPVLMPARTWLGHPAPWEMPLAAVIELAAIAGMAILAGRIYRAALVRGGARVSWSEALRLGRQSDRSA